MDSLNVSCVSVTGDAKENISVVVGVELLPYHSLGAYKYKKLGIPYSMENVPDMDKDTAHRLWKKYFENI